MEIGTKMVDGCLENKYFKMINEPLMDMPKKCITYLKPENKSVEGKTLLFKTNLMLNKLYSFFIRRRRYIRTE